MAVAASVVEPDVLSAPSARKTVVFLRFDSPAEVELIRLAANECGQSINQWCRSILLDEAGELIVDVDCPKCGPSQAVLDEFNGGMPVSGLCCGCKRRINVE